MSARTPPMATDPVGPDWQWDAASNGTHEDNIHQHQYNDQPTLQLPLDALQNAHTVPQDTASVLKALEMYTYELQSERDKAERAYQIANQSVARYRALCAQMHNAQAPIISRLPVELLISIFFFVQNTVVASQVCRYWRVVALSCPRLWSSLHVHPSKGSKHLENLLARSLGHTIDVCFCPVPNMIPKPPAAQNNIQQHLSLPPIYTQQYHPDMCLTPHVVSILAPHASRLRSFELHATVPGTWLTLLPLITSPAPNLRTLHIYTKLHHDVARVPFFGSHTPQLRNVQITGAFPVAQQSLLHGLTFLRLEGVPTAYRPTTIQLSDILKACPELVSLSLLDAGPIPASEHDPLAGLGSQNTVEAEQDPEERQLEIQLPKLRAFAFRDTDIHLTTNTVGSVGMTWFGKNVHAPELAAFHLMLAPHPLAYVPRDRAELDIAMSGVAAAAGAAVGGGVGGAGMVPVAGHSPYSVLSLMNIPPVSLAMRNKTTRILEAVPTLLNLQEMYLWAPHASCAEVRALLMRFPKLRTLEMPMVRDPVETLQMFAHQDTVGRRTIDGGPTVVVDGEMEGVDGYFGLGGAPLYAEPVDSSTGSILDGPLTQDGSSGSSDGSSTSSRRPSISNTTGQWLCPNLERIGIPHIISQEHKELGDALMAVFTARESAAVRAEQSTGLEGYKHSAKRLSTLLAPSGRPAYVSEGVWRWIGERARIQTMLPGEGGMDMLFDDISRDAT